MIQGQRKIGNPYCKMNRVSLFALHWNWIVPAFAILFLRSAVSKFFTPAEASLLQGIMSSEQYVKAAGLNQTVMGLFMLFGIGLGSLTYHYLGIEGAIIIDGVSFLISGTLISLCRIAPEVRLPDGKIRIRDLKLRSMVTDFKEGFLYIQRYKLLLAIVSGFLIFGAVNGVISVLPMFTMKYKLSPDHYQLYASFITIFLCIGFMIGSALASTLVQKLSKVSVLVGGLLLMGAITMVLGKTENLWVYLCLVLVAGVFVAPANAVMGGWIPELVDPSNMGRVSAWTEPLMTMGQSVALGMVALAFPTWVSINMLYIIAGIGVLIAGVYYWLVLPSLNRKQQAAADALASAN
jgi:MFS transporter, DHA3 family, macrolide efflux protein